MKRIFNDVKNYIYPEERRAAGEEDEIKMEFQLLCLLVKQELLKVKRFFCA